MAVNWTGHLTEPRGALASGKEKLLPCCPQVMQGESFEKDDRETREPLRN